MWLKTKQKQGEKSAFLEMQSRQELNGLDEANNPWSKKNGERRGGC